MFYLIEMKFNFSKFPSGNSEIYLDSPILYPAQVQNAIIKHLVAGCAPRGTQTYPPGTEVLPGFPFLSLLPSCLTVITGKDDFFLTALHVSQTSRSDSYQLTRC